MFESKINRGRANGYAPLDSGSKVPLSYLPPIQSTINTGSFATTSSLQSLIGVTGSFATTGSNTFTGDQTLSTIQGTGSLYLKPDSEDSRDFTIYNTEPSDIHIKGNAAYSFFGDDTNYLKIDDNNSEITLRANSTIILETGNGDIIFNPDSGLYKGYAGAGNALVTEGNLGSVTGSFATATSLNTFTESINSKTGSYAITGSNTFIGNQTINGSLTILTPSAGVPNSVSNWDGQGGWNQGSYTNLTTTGGTGEGLTVDVAAGGGGYINIEAISINTPGSGYSNGDVITINNENNLPGTFTIGVEEGSGWAFDISGSLTTPGDINVNGSVVIEGGNLILTGSSVPTNLSGSIGDKKGMVVFDDDYLYYCTLDFIPETYQIVVSNGLSYDTHVTIAKNQPGIPNLSSNGWSITTPGDVTYILTGVYSDGNNWDCEIDNLNSNYNGGTQTMTLTDLNYESTDIWKKVPLSGIITGSQQILDLGFVTGSYTTINSFNSLTQSFNSISQSFNVISGSVEGVDFNGVISGSSQITEFGFATTSSILNVDTSSLVTTSSFNSYTSSLVGTISSSQQITEFGFATTSSVLNVDTSSLVTTSSFNSFSSSINTSTASLNAFSASVRASGSILNTFTSSVNTSTASLNAFSASVRASGSIINTFTSSVNTFSASVNTATASLNSKTGSYATTGSNQFKSDQTITGSLTVTSLTTISASISANSSSLYLTSGSNLYVQNNGLVEITGSLNATSITGSIAATNGVISGSSQLSNIGGLTKNSGSWTVTPGTANYSFTLDLNNTYQIWILGNVPNGIISYNAMVTISNNNVPVVGSQYAWNYVTGNELLFTSIPNQIVGVSGSIVTTVPDGIGATTNTFTFGITNNADASVSVNYGYTKLS